MDKPFDDPFDDVYEDDYDDEAAYPRRTLPRLSLTPEQQVELARVIEERNTCDGTLRGVEEWARATAGVRWSRLRRELQARGGFCDCEVVLNVYDAEPG
jgi:hypothetical protein